MNQLLLNNYIYLKNLNYQQLILRTNRFKMIHTSKNV